ncbi:MAG: thiamine biosynthesis protein ThiF [Clostridia bacterium]|nr:thiamine biosynthesis protein ThiF [Clostridia bacterium]
MMPTKKEWIKALKERHGTKLHHKISEATVAVCGLGGLGSNIATALSRAGVGKLILIDFDKVDITNIHRQQYKVRQIGMFKTDALQENLNEINPYIETEVHTTCLDENNAAGLLAGADIICEAFDNAEAKANLVNFVLENMPDKYIVAASGMAGIGSGNEIKTRKISKKFYVCGDEKSDVTDEVGLIVSRVMICAAHQAHTVLRILAKEFEV